MMFDSSMTTLYKTKKKMQKLFHKKINLTEEHLEWGFIQSIVTERGSGWGRGVVINNGVMILVGHWFSSPSNSWPRNSVLR